MHGQGAQTRGSSVASSTYNSRAYDSASISSSLKSPGTMGIGIGNEPTVLAMMVMSGPGPSGPGLAASTSIAMSTSLSITSTISSVGSPSRITRSGVIAAMPL